MPQRSVDESILYVRQSISDLFRIFVTAREQQVLGLKTNSRAEQISEGLPRERRIYLIKYLSWEMDFGSNVVACVRSRKIKIGKLY